MSKTNEMDFGGLDLVVRSIKFGAPAPGKASTGELGTDVAVPGDLTITGSLFIGATELTEATLIALIAALP